MAFSTRWTAKEGCRHRSTKDLNTQEIKEDRNGTLYLATKGQGLYMKEAYSSIFTKVEGIGNYPIECLYISKSNRIFLGYDGLGITVYNPLTGNIVNNPFFSAQTNLSKSKVQNIIEDNQGNIWISMMQKGVIYQCRRTISKNQHQRDGQRRCIRHQQ